MGEIITVNEIFLQIALVSFGSTEVIKNILHIFFHRVKIGMLISVLFTMCFTIGLGYGMLGASGLDYNSMGIPMLMKYADIVTTAFLLSVGSKGLNALFESRGVNISGSLKKTIDNMSEVLNESFEMVTEPEIMPELLVDDTPEETKDVM